MPKSRKQKSKNNRVMNTAYCNTTTEIPPLTETQKTFAALLAARRLVQDTIAKRDEITDTDRAKRVSVFVSDVSKPNPQIENLAKTACSDIKTLEDTAKQIRDSLVCVAGYLDTLIEQFEKQNCADALAVYRKLMAEFRQSEAQEEEIEKKISYLEECCAKQEVAAK